MDGAKLQEEQILCPACSALGASEFVDVPDHEYAVAHIARYALCAGCGTAYQSPMPSPEALSDFYPADYHSFALRSKLMEIRIGMRVARLGRLLSGEGAVLDYGCGNGAFLRKAAEAFPNRQFFGYEIDGEDRTETFAGGQITIARGHPRVLFEAMPLCRVIVLNHVIEHLPAPRETLLQLVERLAPDGVVDGQTPAMDSYDRKVFRSAWSGYHAPRHTVVFSRAGLRACLEAAGLPDVRLTPAFNPAGIAMSLGALRHGKAPGLVGRGGLEFLVRMGIATGLSLLDYASGAPGIVDFTARRNA